jgi:hypothetical protein
MMLCEIVVTRWLQVILILPLGGILHLSSAVVILMRTYSYFVFLSVEYYDWIVK